MTKKPVASIYSGIAIAVFFVVFVAWRTQHPTTTPDAGPAKTISEEVEACSKEIAKCNSCSAELAGCRSEFSGQLQCWRTLGFPPVSDGGRLEIVTDTRPVFIHASYCKADKPGIVVCCMGDGGCS